ncbi:hypothetical protein [Billgrantia desiderata]|uniref:hypothetical protein n=1 Tax=Billgrantia desiderata TaxID=52021 RepID=UPI00089E89DF|nr:hypothetical protein [Halomonas desiderata]SEG06021.1 hypothetical protein SAMN04487953_11241 [Halomonas desiderata]
MKASYAGLSFPSEPMSRSAAVEALERSGSCWRLALKPRGACGRERLPCALAEVGYRERVRLTPRARANLEALVGIILPGRETALELLVYQPLPVAEGGHHAPRDGWLILVGEEAAQLARWLLDDSAGHFLRHARLGRYTVTAARLSYFRSFLANNRFRHDEVLLDASLVLELYGLRKAECIDYLALAAEVRHRPRIRRNDDDSHHHRCSLREMLATPGCHFRLGELRCVSFEQIIRFKRSRGTFADRRDLSMMQALVTGNRLAILWHRALYEIDLGRRLLSDWLIQRIRPEASGQRLAFSHRWRRRRSH